MKWISNQRVLAATILAVATAGLSLTGCPSNVETLFGGGGSGGVVMLYAPEVRVMAGAVISAVGGPGGGSDLLGGAAGIGCGCAGAGAVIAEDGSPPDDRCAASRCGLRAADVGRAELDIGASELRDESTSESEATAASATTTPAMMSPRPEPERGGAAIGGSAAAGAAPSGAYDAGGGAAGGGGGGGGICNQSSGRIGTSGGHGGGPFGGAGATITGDAGHGGRAGALTTYQGSDGAAGRCCRPSPRG